MSFPLVVVRIKMQATHLSAHFWHLLVLDSSAISCIFPVWVKFCLLFGDSLSISGRSGVTCARLLVPRHIVSSPKSKLPWAEVQIGTLHMVAQLDADSVKSALSAEFFWLKEGLFLMWRILAFIYVLPPTCTCHFFQFYVPTSLCRLLLRSSSWVIPVQTCLTFWVNSANVYARLLPIFLSFWLAAWVWLICLSITYSWQTPSQWGRIMAQNVQKMKNMVVHPNLNPSCFSRIL
jgi:hypothetical protein